MRTFTYAQSWKRGTAKFQIIGEVTAENEEEAKAMIRAQINPKAKVSFKNVKRIRF
jgi:hypothetical protein